MFGNPEDVQAYMDEISGEVLDEHLKQVFGADAEHDTELDHEFSQPELTVLLQALVGQLNESLESGDVVEAALCHRLINVLKENDEGIAQAYEEAQETNPAERLSKMLGGMVVAPGAEHDGFSF